MSEHEEPQEAPESVDEPQDVQEHPEPVEGQETDAQGPEDEQEPDGDTFPRAYVEKLRRENAEARTKAKRVDELGERLHVATLKADGRLADPTDLPYNPAYLDDPDALNAAVTDLLARKPHLASRVPRGDVGQGAKSTTDSFSLAGMLRARA